MFSPSSLLLCFCHHVICSACFNPMSLACSYSYRWTAARGGVGWRGKGREGAVGWGGVGEAIPQQQLFSFLLLRQRDCPSCRSSRDTKIVAFTQRNREQAMPPRLFRYHGRVKRSSPPPYLVGRMTPHVYIPSLAFFGALQVEKESDVCL